LVGLAPVLMPSSLLGIPAVQELKRGDGRLKKGRPIPLHGQNPAFSWGYDDSEAGQERTFGKAGLDRRKNDEWMGENAMGK
jgi:hypothetical protein